MPHMLTYLICRKKRSFEVHMTGFLSLIIYNNLIRYFNLIKVMNQVTTIQDFWTLMSKIFWFCKIQVTFMSCFRNLGKNILSNWFLVDFHYIHVLQTNTYCRIKSVLKVTIGFVKDFKICCFDGGDDDDDDYDHH